MRITGCFIRTSLLTLSSTIAAFAQTGAPPLYPAQPVPPPTGMPAPAPSATNTNPYSAPQYPSQPYNQPAPPPGTAYPPAAPQPNQPSPTAPAPGSAWQTGATSPMSVDVNASASSGFGSTGTSQADTAATETGATHSASDAREYTWLRHNSISGATGLLHTISADSSAPGTFRIGFLSSYYSGSGFLCPNLGACTQPIGVTDTQDTLDRVGGDLTLSATLLPFLEAYAGMHSHATSDNFGRPQLLQVLGDTNLGLKGFLPHQADNVFSVGGLAELRLLNGSGSVGIHTANIALRALGTIDLNNRSDPQQRIPLRFHANFGYLFDNSSSIIEDTENSRGRPVSRIERFGLDINRVNTLFIGIGGEYVNNVVQPFAEWTIDIPSNRQQYTCKPALSSLGDKCLGNDGGFWQRRLGSALGCE